MGERKYRTKTSTSQTTAAAGIDPVDDAKGTPVLDDDTGLDPERHIRYVLGQHAAKPTPFQIAGPEPPAQTVPGRVAQVVTDVDSTSASRHVWMVLALLIVTFCLGTTAVALLLRSVGASADTAAHVYASDRSPSHPTPSLPELPNAAQDTRAAHRNVADLRPIVVNINHEDLSSPPQELHASGKRAEVPEYTVIDLGIVAPVSGVGLGRLAINDLGQVGMTGWSTKGERHAWLWFQGRLKDVTTLGGAHTEIRDLNNHGLATGFADTPDGKEEHAVVWSAAGITDLGTLKGGKSYGLSINDGGQVVGTARTAGSAEYRAFIWDSTRGMRDLNEIAGTTSGLLLTAGYGINADGQVVGSARTSQGATHGFLWDKHRVVDLGVFGFDSFASALNNDGQAVGTSFTPQRFLHTFLISGGSQIDLGTSRDANSFGLGINGKGDVVGASGGATIWDHSHGMRDINSLIQPNSGWLLLEATDVNDAGQIVGYGLRRGELHGFLLTPYVKR